jgi:hypothetical protein
VLSEPASAATEGVYGDGVRLSCDSAARIPLVTRITKSPTKTLSVVEIEVTSVILWPFT